MAKTSTRPKPFTSKKTQAAELSAPDGAGAIRQIPLDQLEPSPFNVRKVAASASDDAELLASISETGIKQNLVVHALSETLHKSDFIVRFARTNGELMRHREDHFSEVA